MDDIRRLLAAGSLLVVPALTSARAQADQIPKELALALIPYGASQGGEIIVGKLPPELAASITLPPGGRVLGSFVSLDYGQAVLTLPISADSAHAVIRRSLVEHGWTERQPMSSRMGGLQYGQRGALPTFFCKAGTPGALNLSTQFYGRETLVRLTQNGGMNCNADMMTGVASSTVGVTSAAISFRNSAMPLATLPPLWSPGDPMSSGRICRPTTSTGPLPYQSQEQTLRSDLSAQQILAFYGKQLDSAGWKSVTAPNDNAASTWTRAAGSDSAQDVTLGVTKLTIPGCYEVTLRATARGPGR